MIDQIIIFVAGAALGAAAVTFGDTMASWYFYRKMKAAEKETRRLEEDNQVLRSWREM